MGFLLEETYILFPGYWRIFSFTTIELSYNRDVAARRRRRVALAPPNVSEAPESSGPTLTSCRRVSGRLPHTRWRASTPASADKERALAYLERAVEERVSHVADLNVDQEFDTLRDDP